jgi:hypothetical protein
VAALAIVLMGVNGVLMIRFPLQMDFAEGVVLQLAHTLAAGESIYRDPQQYPWLITQYTPLYLMTSSWLLGVCGPGFAGARLLSLLSALVCVVLVSLAGRRHGGTLGQAAATAFFVISPLTLGWACLARVDFFGLAFELGLLTWIDLWLAREHARAGPLWSLLAGLLAFAAFYTKQTFVLGTLAALLALWQRSRPAALSVAAWYAMLVLLGCVWIDRISNGFAWALLVRDNALQWSWAQTREYGGAYLLIMLVPLVIALSFGRRSFTHRREPMWLCYLGLTMLTLLGVGRTGAYYNHFLPFHAALAVVAGVGVASWAKVPFDWDRRWLRGLLVVHLVAGWWGHLPAGGSGTKLPDTLPPAAAYVRLFPLLIHGQAAQWIAHADQQLGEYQKMLDQCPGPLLAENLGLPARLGRPSVLCDPSTLFPCARLGLWNERPLLEMIAKHQIGVIVLQKLGADNIRFPADVLALIAREYVARGKVGEDTFLTPREAAAVSLPRGGAMQLTPVDSSRQRQP